ncbi:MAG: hypothetical protein E6504_10810 [Staphylococcus epidermidis]|jgi:hypothetical protein|uniref:Uncharacterized protein n=2 Tax=root TaxID=1 RepID=A0ABV6BI91_9GAMM|nr:MULTISPECIES: hypothetical protein [Bacillota]EGG71844.1 hypothetical protein SEVCU028_0981 [Staphylococcus epidermidis VCU028]MDU1505972.1 hypothetical protein [Limosilactobacillus vaginalis]QLF86536.1 hypothetical protein BESEP1_00032 [Staphylococcus phage vB_SepS_BE01]QQV93475.1 hypothetical protein [Staphylococcus virus vB_SepS_E72]SKU81263.1 Uncharacterised protein [Mycobacteroides abscessus subsp. abscessus]
MVKIKVTKEFDFAELINHIKNTSYQPKEYLAKDGSTKVIVGSLGSITFDNKNFIYPETNFRIEVEKEVTEKTEIDNLVEIVIIDKNIPHTSVFYNTSINERLSITRYRPQVFYMLNDDSTITRIWENGKLVD